MNQYPKYNEVFNINRGILKYCNIQIKTLHNTPDEMHNYQAVYDDKYLNLLCLSNFGNCPLSPVVTTMIENGNISEESLKDLGDIIYHRFQYTWSKYYDILATEYQLIQNGDTFTHTIQETTVINSDTSIFNESRDLYGFNSIDINDSVHDTKNISDTQNLKNSSSRIENFSQVGSWYDAMKIQQAILSELKLREENYLDYIMKDLKRFCTLAVYS